MPSENLAGQAIRALPAVCDDNILVAEWTGEAVGGLDVAGIDNGDDGNVDVWVAERAVDALYREVLLTPKPGLVDSENNGAHRDMDLDVFIHSITAIAPWFARFALYGRQHAHRSAAAFLAGLRPMGMACEQGMFAATEGVNTHKGGIFPLGLLCAAAGRLVGRRRPVGRQNLCLEVAAICAGLVGTELVGGRRGVTAGERLFCRYGLTGARGEAASGFATVRRYALPAWDGLAAAGAAEQRRLLHCLLLLMAHNPDTNLVSRGGLAGLTFVQDYARRLLADGWDIPRLRRMDRALTARRLSPGGSADLLAVTYVLSGLPR
ncbi:triphosphoribosyl-dephospho-CoA synthase CitG [Martelella alba]|uniref:Probable 2-(5''-triphosphoribosyl)-3'-dephosphocoenzyme-A synthase n=1 Tax=Martelella alba TaxID=2590451 RepID=A0ABY2SMH5_9HYPH|nr:triphosphoribosyl-dephospho-CoA synthase CitG [Martelella alba]TKI06552.1 triphosphoribosyl-dephospho-CoA synthase CitG [Martelella alba]